MINETFFALSTVPGKAGIAVIRLSGPASFNILGRLVKSIPRPRQTALRNLVYAGEVLDQAIVVCFEKGRSFTGDEMVELHVHGSQAVVSGVLSVLAEMNDIRFAEPGDFARRALENGVMDLAELEGLGDLIDSETKEQRKQSLKVMTGGLSKKVNYLKKDFLTALALLEVMIDFSDEDVPEDTTKNINELVDQTLKDLSMELNDYYRTRIIKSGLNVAIIGKPNVGKSSLLNYLAGTDKAIVSEHPGTTRDILEAKIDVRGLPVWFYDTAGIRPSSGAIENIGIERAKDKAKKCHMRLFLLDPGDQPHDFDVQVKKTDLFIMSKCDIREPSELPGVSGKTGEGVNDILDKIHHFFSRKPVNSGLLINERHKSSIQRTITFLKSAKKELARKGPDIELVAEDIRSGIREMDILLGRIDVEEVLGRIFSSFCIGK